jgi:Type VI secretion system/phage-baseplate injector OB domain
MAHHRRALVTLCITMVLLAATIAQDRTAMRIAIDGAAVPAEVQPRAVVEQLRGASDQARIQLAGPPGLAYAATIVAGSRVEITSMTLAGELGAVFSGAVVSLEYLSDAPNPSVVIHASAESPRDERAPGPALTLLTGPGADARLLGFAPRLSGSASIQEVRVSGIESSTGLPITGRAAAPTLLLGWSDASFGRVVEIATGERFASIDDANAYASSKLLELLDTRVSAEVVTTGLADLRVGADVVVRGVGGIFDGAYVITGVSHRFGPDSYGGYSTALRLLRADLGMFRLPSIDDEVLVAFEHGDLNQPIIIESWWSCDDKPRAAGSSDDGHCRILRWPW